MRYNNFVMGKFLGSLYRYRNKIGAISLLSIGLLLYMTCYLIIEISFEWSYFRMAFQSGSISAIWNFLIALFCYVYLLVTNIRNDNAAYTGIFIFISLIVFEGIFTLIDMIRLLAGLGEIGVTVGFVLYCLALVLIVASGIFFYITIYRYLSNRNPDFKRVRLAGFLFLGTLVLMAGSLILFYGLSGTLSLFDSALMVLALPLSEVFICGGVLFTLERLRRV